MSLADELSLSIDQGRLNYQAPNPTTLAAIQDARADGLEAGIARFTARIPELDVHVNKRLRGSYTDAPIDYFDGMWGPFSHPSLHGSYAYREEFSEGFRKGFRHAALNHYAAAFRLAATRRSSGEPPVKPQARLINNRSFALEMPGAFTRTLQPA